MHEFLTSNRELVVDGQHVYVPEEGLWQTLKEDQNFFGQPISPSIDSALVSSMVEFSSAHPDEFCFGLYRPGEMKKWIPLILFKAGEDWVRVQIEQHACSECGWIGLAANAMEPSLFFGVPGSTAAFQRACARPVVGCPRCGAGLPRRPIWVEKE